MIGDWRTHWGEGDFPFLIVQLAGFMHAPAQPGDDAWAELREAQWMTAHDTPNAGIVTAIDIGNPDDIHPQNKQEVGRRLSLVARVQVYHEKLEDAGPVYKSMSVEGGTIRLTLHPCRRRAGDAGRRGTEGLRRRRGRPQVGLGGRQD